MEKSGTHTKQTKNLYNMFPNQQCYYFTLKNIRQSIFKSHVKFINFDFWEFIFNTYNYILCCVYRITHSKNILPVGFKIIIGIGILFIVPFLMKWILVLKQLIFKLSQFLEFVELYYKNYLVSYVAINLNQNSCNCFWLVLLFQN